MEEAWDLSFDRLLMMMMKQPDISYDVFNGLNLLILCNNHLYKSFHLINIVALACMILNSLRMMYEHRNMQDCLKKHMLCICWTNIFKE